MKALGRHIFVELYECDPEMLNDISHIENSMVNAAKEADATVINSTFHHFSPFGISGVVVIQESHLAIHTWPEYGYAAIDIFTCGDLVNPWISYKSLKASLAAKHGSAMEMRRGQLELLEKISTDLKTLRDSNEKELMHPKFSRNIWFTDRDDNIALSLRHKGDLLFKEKSPYQKVEVYDTFAYGKMLAIDQMVMCTEKDEYAYHEMIAHVPLFTHPNAKNILVIGGGDGGTVREILRHENVDKVTLVEIDEAVIRASREHLPTFSSAFNHPKLDLKIQDGIKYIFDSADESYDIVIVDSTDPYGPAEGLFSEEFYRNVHRSLRPGGLMITQSESPRFNVKTFQEIFYCYQNIFGSDHVFCYLVFVSTYPTGMWSLSYSAKGDIHPLNNLDSDKIEGFVKEHSLQYYNEQVHRAAFALPNFAKDLIRPK